VPTDQVDAAAKASALWSTYATEVDRESAREILAAKMAASAQVAEQEAAGGGGAGGAKAAPKKAARPEQPKGSGKHHQNRTGKYLGSREGRSLVNTVVRGVFGLLKKR